MDSKDWDRLCEVYEAARGLEPAERGRLVEERLGDRPDLVEEALRMLGLTPPPGFVEPVRTPEELDQYFGGGLDGKVLGDFELLYELGRGGMGVVYLALQRELGRRAAVKVLPLSRATDERSHERFRREAHSASQLDHPHVAQVLAFGQLDRTSWYAMRYVEGHDLATEITAQRGAREGRGEATLLLPEFGSAEYVGVVVQRLADLAAALQHAHDQGVVHRDVKPQNILLDLEGRMHLADFGLAKDERFGTLTETGDLRGTPYYMSPEQARAGAVRVDHRTDVYSLSVVLYELLALVRPYEGRTSQEVISRIERTDPEPLSRRNPRVHRDLGVICAKGMSKVVRERYASAGELREDLLRFLRHEAILAKPPSPGRRIGRWIHRNRVVSVAAGTLAIASVTGFFAARWFEREARRSDLHQRLVAALDLDDWSNFHQDLVALRHDMAELPAFGSGERTARSVDLVRFSERLDRFKQDQLELGNGLLDEGLSGRTGTQDPDSLPGTQRPLALSEGMLVLEQLANVFPEDEEIARSASLARILTPVELRCQRVDDQGVAVDVSPGEVEVFVAPFDVVRDTLDELRRIDSPDPTSFRLPPGFWSVEVRIPGHGRAELARNVPISSTPLRLTARVHPSASVVQGMVRIPDLTWSLPDPRPEGCLHVPGPVDVPGFHLDVREVSNGLVLLLPAGFRGARSASVDQARIRRRLALAADRRPRGGVAPAAGRDDELHGRTGVLRVDGEAASSPHRARARVPGGE